MVGTADAFNQGFTISGSDLVKNKNTSRLEKMGAKIFLGHNKKNVSEADVIVYSSAVVKSNPEIKAAEMLNKTIIPRAEMLASLMKVFIALLLLVPMEKHLQQALSLIFLLKQTLTLLLSLEEDSWPRVQDIFRSKRLYNCRGR